MAAFDRDPEISLRKILIEDEGHHAVSDLQLQGPSAL